jgi:Cdc6-like AAA superfamily ATPase
LILIGASNTIDLIEQLNQQYKISSSIKNIVFEPYTYDEIFSILKERVYNTSGFEKQGQIFDEFGLKFCAKKIYSLKGGDIRCVLDIVKKVYVDKSEASLSNADKIALDDMLKVN